MEKTEISQVKLGVKNVKLDEEEHILHLEKSKMGVDAKIICKNKEISFHLTIDDKGIKLDSKSKQKLLFAFNSHKETFLSLVKSKAHEIIKFSRAC